MAGVSPTSGMTRITLSFLLSLLSDNFPGPAVPSNSKHHWSYKGPEGPSSWPVHYKHCAGIKQSPIDIVPATTVFDPDLGSFHLENFHSYSQPRGPTLLNITNNGHAASVRVTSNMRITGGGLNGTYKTAEFHFHWGSTDDVGSEHALSGRKFPLEMHVVNFAEKYGTIKDAMTQPDGLAVLGVFFELSDQDNPEFAALDEALRFVHKAGEHNLVKRLRLRYLLPQDVTRYWRYSGSLTTPFCFESVTWTVFNELQKISRTQLEALRSLLHEDNHDIAMTGINSPTPSRLVDNWRPIQPLNGRVVYRSFNDPPVRPLVAHSPLSSNMQAQPVPTRRTEMVPNAHPTASLQGVRNIDNQSPITKSTSGSGGNQPSKGLGISSAAAGHRVPQQGNSVVAVNYQETNNLPTEQHSMIRFPSVSGRQTDTSGKFQPSPTAASMPVNPSHGIASMFNAQNLAKQISFNQTRVLVGSSGMGNGAFQKTGALQSQMNKKVGMTLSSFPEKLAKSSSRPRALSSVIGQSQQPSEIPNLSGLPRLSDPQPNTLNNMRLGLMANGTSKVQPSALPTNFISGPAITQQQNGLNAGSVAATARTLGLSPGSRIDQSAGISAIQQLVNGPVVSQQNDRFKKLQTQRQPNFQNIQFFQPQQSQQQSQQQTVYQQQLPQQGLTSDPNAQYQVIQRPYQSLRQQLALQQQTQQQQQQKHQQQQNPQQISYIYNQQSQNGLNNNVQIRRQLNSNGIQPSGVRYVYRTQQQRVETRPTASSQQLRNLLGQLSANNRINTVSRTSTSPASRMNSGKTGSNSLQSPNRVINRAPMTILRNVNGRVIASRPQTMPQPERNVQQNSGRIVPSGLRQSGLPTVRISSINQRPGTVATQPSLALPQRVYGSNQASFSSSQRQGNIVNGAPRVFLSQPASQQLSVASGVNTKLSPGKEIPYVFLHRLEQPVRIRRPYYEKLYNLQGRPSSFAVPASSSNRHISSQQLLSLHAGTGDFNEFQLS